MNVLKKFFEVSTLLNSTTVVVYEKDVVLTDSDSTNSDIDREAPIVNLPPYRVPMTTSSSVKSELDTLLEQSIIEPSNSLWSSPIIPVIKPNGKIRVCMDFRHLNGITPQFHYPIPLLDHILEKAGRAHCLSKLDLSKEFHQLCRNDRSKELTTFVSPFGKYQFVRMPFGLRNAPAIFQQAIEIVLSDCSNLSSVYIDDVLVYSDS